MNEKLQYAEMLEIPYATCSVSYKQSKKRLFPKRKKPDGEVKGELIDKINEGVPAPDALDTEQVIKDKVGEVDSLILEEENAEVIEREERAKRVAEELFKEEETVVIRAKKKPKFKINILAVQFALIGVLALTIILTNALIPQSGINTFMSKVFGESVSTADIPDERVYSDFTVGLPSDNAQIVLSNGVMTFSADGSIYPCCDGEVSSLEQIDGKYTVEITHNSNFKTVIAGLEHAYFGKGDLVKANLPVGYAKSQSATMCFYDGDGAIITEYSVGENAIQWAV